MSMLRTSSSTCAFEFYSIVFKDWTRIYWKTCLVLSFINDLTNLDWSVSINKWGVEPGGSKPLCYHCTRAICWCWVPERNTISCFSGLNFPGMIFVATRFGKKILPAAKYYLPGHKSYLSTAIFLRYLSSTSRKSSQFFCGKIFTGWIPNCIFSCVVCIYLSITFLFRN